MRNIDFIRFFAFGGVQLFDGFFSQSSKRVRISKKPSLSIEISGSYFDSAPNMGGGVFEKGGGVPW